MRWIEKLATSQILLIFLAVGFVVFFGTFFNGFVADDNVQILANPSVRNLNITSIFLGSSYYGGNIGALAGLYYKPIFILFTSILFNLSGGTPFLMHAFQLFVHITNAFLVFLFFSKFFKRQLAFFLGLLFLVHPGNTETVAYISNLQDTLFFLFGILALLVSYKMRLTSKRFALISSLLLLSLLSKESGILFVAAVFLQALFFDKTSFKRVSVLSVSIIVFYLFLRFVVAQVPINHQEIAPIMSAGPTIRFITVPKIIASYLILFVFPLQLSWAQHWLVAKMNLKDFFIPLLTIGFTFFSFGFIYTKLQTKPRKIFLFFLLSLSAGLILHSHIIPLDFTFAERWFYFMCFALLGLVGIIISEFRILNLHKKILICLAVFVLLFSSVRTAIRVTNWKDDMTLASHDLLVNRDSPTLENNLGFLFIQSQEYKKALPHLEKSIELYPDSSSYNNLAYTYTKLGEYNKAFETYEKSLTVNTYFMTYQNYAADLIRNEKYDKAKKVLTKALVEFPNNPKLWLLYSLVEYRTGNSEEAIKRAQQANLISPHSGDFLILKIQKKEEIPL